MKKTFLLLPVILALALGARFAEAARIGVISDPHTRNNRPWIMDNFIAKVAQMKAGDLDAIIVAGDLTDKGQAACYARLKEISGVIWVKGNKDGKRFKTLSPENYFVDFAKFRVIVLDSNKKKKNSSGGLKKSQLNFLRDAQNTNKNVIVAMHHPVFKRGKNKINKRYKKFLATLAPNVKVVVSGHHHRNFESVINGTRFITVTSFLLSYGHREIII